MKIKSLFLIFLFVVFAIVLFTSAYTGEPMNDENNDDSWNKQLKEMNYLVIKISSVNVINGLFLTQQQAEDLKKLAKDFETPDIPLLDTTGKMSHELINVRRAYITLLDHLLKKKPINDSLKKWVNSSRVLEAEIIKKSILGAQKSGYKGEGCKECHAPPSKFPKGDISKMETKNISVKDRKTIDKAHTVGLFGEQGMISLWNMKENADKVLTDGQRYIMKNFRCCLIPPGDLSDPTNIGQAFITNDWINYFLAIRKLTDKNWQIYKPLFIQPLDTLIKATLPGIKAKERKVRLSEAEAVINKARKMDDIDFELQKESLCMQMKDALKVTSLTGESDRQAKVRQFVTAMFLLFPGSADVYDAIIKQTN